MITKWANSLLLASISNKIIPSLEQVSTVQVGIVNAKSGLNENVFISPFTNYSGDYFKVKPFDNTEGIWIGSGNTPATENDYFLETPITSGCTGSTSKQTIYDAETNTVKTRLVVTITNNGSSDVTINEICKTDIFPTANAKGANTNQGNKGVMVDRCVLESPVTIPAGESGVIHYEFIYYTETNQRATKAKGA